MLELTLDLDLDEIIDEIDDVMLRQIPYASQLALNETVFKTSIYVKKVMPYFIEGGPTPFTRRGVQYRKAKSKRHLVASVFIPKAQWKYMQWVIDGGTKRSDNIRHGLGFPVTSNVRFNKYGNLPGRRRKEKIWRDMLNNQAGPPRGKLGKNDFIATIKGIAGLRRRLG